MYGDDWNYADSRLAGTIVRLEDGEPVFVHGIRHGMEATVCKLSDLYNNQIVNANTLNLVPVPLGMCNFDKRAHYLSRIPMRRDWKQGLRKENFMSHTVHVQLIPPHILRAVIVGEYPPLEECIAMCEKKEVTSAAWNRAWAVTVDGNLIYKEEGKVGVVKKGVLALDEQYRYLQEALQEVA